MHRTGRSRWSLLTAGNLPPAPRHSGPRDPRPGHAAVTKEAESTPEATEGRGTSLENKEDEFIRKVSACILMHLYKRPADLSSRRPVGEQAPPQRAKCWLRAVSHCQLGREVTLISY